MKRILIINLLLSIFSSSYAQKFEDYFEDRTLRIDYTFSGNNQQQQLYVDELISMPRWYGKRQRLAEVPLKGNGQIIVRSATDETVIYRNSFSTLFQECDLSQFILYPFPRMAGYGRIKTDTEIV